MSSAFDIEVEVVPIETVLGDRDIQKELGNIKTLGGFFEDYVEVLRQEGMTEYCKQRKVEKVILPEYSEQLSARALNLLCKSRSVEIAQSCAGCFKVDENIRVGRPLFDISKKELLFYSRNKGLFEHVFNDENTFEKNIQKVRTGSNFAKYVAEGSIGMLLEKFVEEVQGEYSSTSATILRTVAKLDLGGQPRVCPNCGHGFDPCKDLASLVKSSKEPQKDMCSGCQIMFGLLDY
jgi:tRNA(Ile)-lysidine synthase TilS/MesJ